jgi:hypothetical protein
MSNTKKIVNLWKEIFYKNKYLFIFLLGIILFYSLNISVTNFWMIIDFYKTSTFLQASISFLNLIFSFRKNIMFSSFLSMLIISILSSFLLCLVIYNTVALRKRVNKKVSFFMVFGLSLGMFAPGCVACGLGIAGLIGLATSFVILPFKGKERGIFAIFVLFFSILKTSLDLTKPCFLIQPIKN